MISAQASAADDTSPQQQQQPPPPQDKIKANESNNNGISARMNDDHHHITTSTSTSFTNNHPLSGDISATLIDGSPSSRTLLIKDTPLSSSDGFSSLMNHHKRRIRKRKEHPSSSPENGNNNNKHNHSNGHHHNNNNNSPNSTTIQQQLTKRTKSNSLSSLSSAALPAVMGIEYASNSAFLLSNILQASSLFTCSYNNTTLSYDPNAVLECPWKINGNDSTSVIGETSSSCLALEEPATLENRLKRLLVVGRESREELASSSSPLASTTTTAATSLSSKYALHIDPYCTLMLTGGRVYAENLDNHQATVPNDSVSKLSNNKHDQAFNVLIHGLQDGQFVILQLQTHLLFRNVFVVYSRFGTLGSSGKTYSRLFDNLHHAKQFFANSLQSLLGLNHDGDENSHSNVVSPSVATLSKVCYQVPRICLHHQQ
ncbi:hypothetical protein FDP41_011301 [Naegleria fowleri]|uniref:WGR domain-containing protein n=1 Tax=Naegleria fowleri TaxID=5763 RepID=A0A6A5C5L2_NAEFO|nr:uncharacterized protein FDP41_011301 [Naegleria fowleri]KAF0982371.1 hypothetical protein FDP41_011301 [Naegleria fowleri]CAG4716648.1 unnamed protein product [Naegleria fowleri]